MVMTSYNSIVDTIKKMRINEFPYVFEFICEKIILYKQSFNISSFNNRNLARAKSEMIFGKFITMNLKMHSSTLCNELNKRLFVNLNFKSDR